MKVERLSDQSVNTRSIHFGDGVLVRSGGNDDARQQRWSFGSEAIDNLKTVHCREHQSENDRRVFAVENLRPAVEAVRSEFDLEPSAGQNHAKQLLKLAIMVNDEELPLEHRDLGARSLRPLGAKSKILVSYLRLPKAACFHFP